MGHKCSLREGTRCNQFLAAASSWHQCVVQVLLFPLGMDMNPHPLWDALETTWRHWTALWNAAPRAQSTHPLITSSTKLVCLVRCQRHQLCLSLLTFFIVLVESHCRRIAQSHEPWVWLSNGSLYTYFKPLQDKFSFLLFIFFGIMPLTMN